MQLRGLLRSHCPQPLQFFGDLFNRIHNLIGGFFRLVYNGLQLHPHIHLGLPATGVGDGLHHIQNLPKSLRCPILRHVYQLTGGINFHGYFVKPALEQVFHPVQSLAQGAERVTQDLILLNQCVACIWICLCRYTSYLPNHFKFKNITVTGNG